MDFASRSPSTSQGADTRSTPMVSVVMVCRDGHPYLSAALRSVTDQTFRSWELVFWDNGSQDGSADLARALGPKARILGGAELLTLGDARRRAIETSRGRYIALLDADDLWREDKLERQVQRMEQGDVAACYSECDVVAADGRRLGRYSRHTPPAAGRVRHALLGANCMATSTVMVSREACLQAGGPDPSLNAAADYELWLRVAALAPVAYDREPLASYRVHRDTLTGDFASIYAENRRIYNDLLARNGDGPAREHRLVRAALASLLWKWAARELLRGDGPGAAVRRSREAWAVAASPAQALSDLSQCAARSLKGLGLRIAMHRER